MVILFFMKKLNIVEFGNLHNCGINFLGEKMASSEKFCEELNAKTSEEVPNLNNIKDFDCHKNCLVYCTSDS
jgi:hypothetical protein